MRNALNTMSLLLKKRGVATTKTRSRPTPVGRTAPQHGRQVRSRGAGSQSAAWAGTPYRGAGKPGLDRPETPTAEVVSSAYCRHCLAYCPLSAIRTLSAHSTSEGLVTYFRCPLGHADFYVGVIAVTGRRTDGSGGA